MAFNWEEAIRPKVKEFKKEFPRRKPTYRNLWRIIDDLRYELEDKAYAGEIDKADIAELLANVSFQESEDIGLGRDTMEFSKPEQIMYELAEAMLSGKDEAFNKELAQEALELKRAKARSKTEAAFKQQDEEMLNPESELENILEGKLSMAKKGKDTVSDETMKYIDEVLRGVFRG